MRWTSSLPWSSGETYDPEGCGHLHLKAHVGRPETGLALLRVLTTVLELWYGTGPGPRCQELNCREGLLLWPLKRTRFIYLCDLKWPCTVGRDVNRLEAGVGFPSCWPPVAISKKTWGPSSRTRSSLPAMLLCAPLAGRLLPPGRGGKGQWSPAGLAPQKGWVCCPPQAAPAWEGPWGVCGCPW